MNRLLILSLLRRYWKYAAGAILLALIWLAWHRHGVTQYNAGIAAEKKLWADSNAAYTRKHEAKIAKLDEDYHAREIDLKAQLAALLARPPPTRYIRVPIAAVCPPQRRTEAASVPETADSGSGFVAVDDPGFGPLRQWLLQYAAGPGAGSRADAAVLTPSP